MLHRLHLERFHNLRAPILIVQGAIFLRKMPLESSGFGIQQLWNRYRCTVRPRATKKAGGSVDGIRPPFVHSGKREKCRALLFQAMSAARGVADVNLRLDAGFGGIPLAQFRGKSLGLTLLHQIDGAAAEAASR